MVMGLDGAGGEDGGGEEGESVEEGDQMCQRIGDFGPWQVGFME